MDAVSDRYRTGLPTGDEFALNLSPLIAVCNWTTGYWEFGPGKQRKWNEIQNTSKDIFLLANYLLFQYKKLVWDHALREA